jgi:hypothetical protein
MTVIIHTPLYHAPTVPSTTRMTSLSVILLVNVVTHLVCAFPLNKNCKDAMEFIGPHAAKLGR